MAYKKDDNGGQAAASAAPSSGSSSASGNYSRSGSPSASSKASPKPSARSSGGGSRDSSAHAAASADRAAAAGRGKVATFTPTRKSSTPWALDWADGEHGSSKQSRFGSGIDNSGRPLSGQFSLQGAPTKAGIYAGGGLNPSAWGSSFTSPIRGSDDPAFQKALDNLTIPVDYPDRNFHGIAPKKGADESYLQKAEKITYGRNLWAYNDTQGVFSRKYASTDEKLADILDLMTHAQVYYKDALDKDYKFDVDGKEVSAADSWKDLYDRLDRYSGWLTDIGQTQDLFTRFENGDDISPQNVDTMIARAQARADNPYDDEDAAMWQSTVDWLNGMWNSVNRQNAQSLQEQIDDYKTQLARVTTDAGSYAAGAAWLDDATVIASDAEKADYKAKADELTSERARLLDEQAALQTQLDELNGVYRERNMTPEIEEALYAQSLGAMAKEKYYTDKAREELTRLDEEGRVTNAAVSLRANEMESQNQKLLDDWNRGLGFNPQFYNDWDRARGALAGSVLQAASGVASAVNWGAKAGAAMGAGKTEYGSGRSVLEAPPAAPIKISSAEEGEALIASLGTQIADLEAQKNAILNEGRSAPVDGDGKQFHSRTLQQSTSRLGNLADVEKQLRSLHEQLGEIEFQTKQLNGEPTSVLDKLKYLSVDELTAKADAVIDTMDTKSAELIGKAKEGASDLGKLLIDIEVNGIQMAGDQAFGPASLAMLGTRVFGNEVSEKRREGYGVWQQGAAGATRAAIEVTSESIFNVMGMYGNKGLTLETTERLVREWADTDLGRTFMRTVISTVGEQGEEWVSWHFAPLVDIVLGKENWAALNPFKIRTEKDYEDLVNSVLVAGALAGGLSAVNVSGNKAANAALFEADTTEYESRTDQYDRDIEAANSEMTPFTDEQQSNFDRVRALQNRIENNIAGRRTLDAKGAPINPEAAALQSKRQAAGMEGYAQRFSESELMQKIRASIQSLLDRRGQANAGTQAIDNSGTIETQDQEIADAQAEALKGQETSPVPAPKPTETEETPTSPETPQGEEVAPPQAETPESPQPVVKPKGSAPQSDLGSKAARKEKSEQNKAARAQLEADNEARRKADNEAIDTAFANKEKGEGDTVAFDGTLSGESVQVVYNAGAGTLTYIHGDGTIDPLQNISPTTAKKLVNEARSTLTTGEAQPAAAVSVVEETEETGEPETSGPDENIVSTIRNAQSIDELRNLFTTNPDAFADAYEAVAGKPLSPGSAAVDEITALYDTLHSSEETEAVAGEAEAEEEAVAPTESEEEEAAPTGPDYLKLAHDNADQVIRQANEDGEFNDNDAEAVLDYCYKHGIDAEIIVDDDSKAVGIRVEDEEYRFQGAKKAAEPAKIAGAVQASPESPTAVPATESTSEPSDKSLVSENGKVKTKADAGPKTAADGTTLDNVVERIGKKEITDAKQIEQYFGRKGEIGSWNILAKSLGLEGYRDAHRAVKAYLKQQNAPQTQTPKTPSKKERPSTPEAYARQLANDWITGTMDASLVASMLDNDSKAAAILSDTVIDAFPDVKDDIDTAAFVREVLAENGIKLTNKKGADLIANYGKLNKDARKLVQAEVAKAITQLRQSAREASKTDIRALQLDNEELGDITPTEGGTQNVSAGQGLQSGRVLSGGEAEVRARYQQNATGRNVSEADESFAAWKRYNDYYEADGAVRVRYEDLTPEYQKASDELLDAGIPFVTVYDVSNSKNPGTLCGFVDAAHPGMGVVLFVNNPNAKSNAVTPGIVVLHEPVHYFAAKARKAGTTVSFADAIDSVAESVAGEDFDYVWDNLVDREMRFSGRAVLGKYEIDFTDTEWKTFRDMPLRQKVTELQAKIAAKYQTPAVQDFIYNQIFDETYEELTANLAAKNPALHLTNTEVVSRSARDYLYNNGVVPAGFFERLDGPASQMKSSEGTIARRALNTRLMQNQKGLELDETASYQPIDPQGIEEFYVQPSGEDTGVRTNTPISERITSQERAKAGEITYQQTSLKSVGQAAHESIEQILDHPEFGFDKLTEHLLNKNPAAINTLEQQMINELYDRVQTQRSNLLHVENPPIDSRITTDVKELWRLERQLRVKSSESAGEGARKTAQQRFAMTPEQEVLNNFRHTFIGDADPTTKDTTSVESKMYGIGVTTVAGITDIDARRKNGEISEQQAVQEMLAMAREINKIRDVAKTFGPAGAVMARWEQACLDRIATKSDSAYDTLRMIALGSVNRVCSDFDSVGAINTLKQIRYLNLLSNPATTLSNFLNNFESSFSGAVGQTVGNKLAGKRAQNIMGGDAPLTGNANWHRGLIGKTNKALNEYMLTKGAESVLSLYYGLDVDEGVIDIDLGAKHNQNGTTASRLLATFQFMSGLNMTTTDAMAIARAYKGMEMEIDKMDVSPARKAELKADAMYEARRQMYHEDSKAAKAMENVRDFMNGVTILSSESGGKLGLGDVVMPFVQVPTNVAVRAMKASPVGIIYGFGKYVQGMRALEARRSKYDKVQDLIKRQEAGVALTLTEAKFLRENRGVSAPTDAEVRKLMRTLGSSCTNATATAFAVIAAMAGGLVDFDDEDDETLKRLAKERNFTGLQLNLSHVLRLGRGEWKKEDVVIGGSWLQVLAIPMVAGHQIFKSWTEEDASAGAVVESILKSPFTTFQTFVDAAQEIPGVKQMVDIWDAYENVQQYGDFEQQKNKVVAGLSQYAANAASTFVIPNAVAQFAAGMDNTARDVFRADKNWQIAVNILKNKIPWVRETIPELKTSLGDTRTYGSNKAMGIINRMVIPGTGIQKWVPTALEEEYRRIAESGENIASIAPAASAPSAITSLDGKEYSLNAEEARYFDENYTENTVRLQYALMNQPWYAELTDAQKAAAMNKLRQFEDHIAKTDFLLSRGDESGVAMDNWEKLYLKSDETSATISSIESAAQYAAAYAAATEIYSTKTREFTGSDKTEWFLDNVYGKLSDDQKAAFDGSFPNMDKLYDGYSKAGITPEEFNRMRELNRQYTEIAKNEDNGTSYSEAQRDLAVAYDKEFGATKGEWAIENNKIWYTLPANTETHEKLVNAGLSIPDADSWLDRKSQIVPAPGYKSPAQSQYIQNLASSSISADDQWRVLLTDGDFSDSARNRLSEYKVKHPKATLSDAVNNVTYWYKEWGNPKAPWELKSYKDTPVKEEKEEKSYPYAEKLAKNLGLP